MELTQPKPAVRDGGVEVFRCLLMVLIVLHHCCVHGPLASTPSAWALFALTVPGVDCFVAISGWYGIRFTWDKFLRLWGVIAFYSLLLWGISNGLAWWHGTPLRLIPVITGNWFGGSYLGLMLIAPLINAGIETLSREPKKLLGAWGLYAFAVTAAALPMRGMTAISPSGWSSHTLSTLLFVYVTLRTVRLLPEAWLAPLIRWRKLLLATLLAGLLILAAARFGYYLYLKGKVGDCIFIHWYGGYNMPQIWLTAVVAFLCFQRWTPPTWLGRTAQFLGPSMFGVYLFHESLLRRYLYQRPEAWFNATYPELPAWIPILLCTAFTFVVSLGVDLLRRAALALLRRLRRA